MAHELGASNTAVAKLMGSRQLVGEQEIGLSKEQDDKLQQTAEGCEANQEVDSNGGTQGLRGESQIAGLAPFLDVPQKVDSNGGAQELRENRKSQAWHRLGASRPVLQFHEPSFRNHRSLEIFSAKALISSRDFVPAALFICRRMMIAPFRAMMR